MDLWFGLTRLATGANILLLVGLTYVWVRNYTRLKSRLTTGLVAFGGLMLAENVYALYLFALDPTTRSWFGDIPTLYRRAFMILALLQLGALLALAWVTWE